MLSQKVRGAGGAGGANLELIGYHWNSSSLTLTRGVDYEDGDFLFCYMHYYSNVLINDEVGWTLINRALYSTYQSYTFSYIKANTATLTVNNGNRDNVIVVFRPTGYTDLNIIDEDEGLNGATADISMTDTDDSLYIGFSSTVSGEPTDVAVPSFATIVDDAASDGAVKFYYAYLPAGHGNTGSQVLDVSGTFELCTAAQMRLT
jgi:hypothetical protein